MRQILKVKPLEYYVTCCKLRAQLNVSETHKATPMVLSCDGSGQINQLNEMKPLF